MREHDLDGQVTAVDSAGLRAYSHDDACRITGITDATDPTLHRSIHEGNRVCFEFIGVIDLMELGLEAE